MIHIQAILVSSSNLTQSFDISKKQLGLGQAEDTDHDHLLSSGREMETPVEYNAAAASI